LLRYLLRPIELYNTDTIVLIDLLRKWNIERLIEEREVILEAKGKAKRIEDNIELSSLDNTLEDIETLSYKPSSTFTREFLDSLEKELLDSNSPSQGIINDPSIIEEDRLARIILEKESSSSNIVSREDNRSRLRNLVLILLGDIILRDTYDPSFYTNLDNLIDNLVFLLDIYLSNSCLLCLFNKLKPPYKGHRLEDCIGLDFNKTKEKVIRQLRLFKDKDPKVGFFIEEITKEDSYIDNSNLIFRDIIIAIVYTNKQKHIPILTSLRFKVRLTNIVSSLLIETSLYNYYVPNLIKLLEELDIKGLERMNIDTIEGPSILASSREITSSNRPSTPPNLGSLDTSLRQLSITPRSTTKGFKRLRDTGPSLSLDKATILDSPTKYRPTKRAKDIEEPSPKLSSIVDTSKSTSIENIDSKDIVGDTSTKEDAIEDIIQDFIDDTIDDTIEETLEDINLSTKDRIVRTSKEPIFKKPKAIDLTTTEEYKQFKALEDRESVGLVKSNIIWARLPTSINLDCLKTDPRYPNIGRIIIELGERVLSTCLICLERGEPNKNKHSIYSCPSLLELDRKNIQEDYLATKLNITRRDLVEKGSSKTIVLGSTNEFDSECFLPHIICYYFRDTLGSSKRCYIGLEFFTFIYYLYKYKLGNISRVFYLLGAKNLFLNYLTSNEKRIESFRPISKALFIFLVYIKDIVVRDIGTS